MSATTRHLEELPDDPAFIASVTAIIRLHREFVERWGLAAFRLHFERPLESLSPESADIVVRVALGIDPKTVPTTAIGNYLADLG